MPFSRPRYFLLKRRGSGRAFYYYSVPYEHKKEILFLKETNDHMEFGREKQRISRYWNKDSVLAARF
jgi:hypothetical protein